MATTIGALNFNAEDAEAKGLTVDQFAALKLLAGGLSESI